MNTALFVTFVVGLGSLWVVRRALVKHQFHFFAYYCFAISILGFLNAWSILNLN